MAEEFNYPVFVEELDSPADAARQERDGERDDTVGNEHDALPERLRRLEERNADGIIRRRNRPPVGLGRVGHVSEDARTPEEGPQNDAGDSPGGAAAGG